MIHEVVSSLLLYLMRGRGKCKGRVVRPCSENAGSENAVKYMDRSDSCSCASVGVGLVGGCGSGTFFLCFMQLDKDMHNLYLLVPEGEGVGNHLLLW